MKPLTWRPVSSDSLRGLSLPMCQASTCDLMCPFKMLDQAFIICIMYVTLLELPVPPTSPPAISRVCSHWLTSGPISSSQTLPTPRARSTPCTTVRWFLAISLSNLAASARLASTALTSLRKTRGDTVTSVVCLRSSFTYCFSSQTQ